ncbi:MAG TPA: KOW motif-containing protein, partial [Candidatus Omnitrophota bacterium]|nr:KOW motif-containing protein [Candidatus Omnitrophota bacterium]
RVISGPFRGYTGIVDEINAEKGKLKVLISIFGRDTPVEVNFEHAEKIV